MSFSKNKLNEFHMCLALSASGIESHLQATLDTFARADRTGDDVKISATTTINRGHVSLSLDATLSSQSVAFTRAQGGAMVVSFTLTDVVVRYTDPSRWQRPRRFDERPLAMQTETVAKIVFSSQVAVNRVAIDNRKLVEVAYGTTNGETETITRDVLPGGHKEDVISGESIFLNFADVTFDGRKGAQVSVDGSLSEQGVIAARRCMESWLRRGFASGMPLGTVVRRAVKHNDATLALSDLTVQITPNTRTPAAGTLAFLGMFDGAALPADIDGAKRAMGDTWLDGDVLSGEAATLHGRMFIKRDYVLERVVLPALRACLDSGGMGLTVDMRDGVIVYKRQGAVGLSPRDENPAAPHCITELYFRPKPGSAEIVISGFVAAGIETSLNLLVTKSGKSVAARQGIGGAIVLSDSGAGTSYQIGFTSTCDVTGDKEWESSTDLFLGLADKITGSEYDIAMSRLIGNIVENLTSDIKKAMNGLTLPISGGVFIPPSGSELNYSGAIFSDQTGDLVLDAQFVFPIAG